MQIWNEVGNAEGVKIGDEVKITIDENVRNRHAKLHSAGHLIDLAVQNLGTRNDRKDTDGRLPKGTTFKMDHMSNTKVQIRIYSKKQPS